MDPKFKVGDLVKVKNDSKYVASVPHNIGIIDSVNRAADRVIIYRVCFKSESPFDQEAAISAWFYEDDLYGPEQIKDEYCEQDLYNLAIQKLEEQFKRQSNYTTPYHNRYISPKYDPSRIIFNDPATIVFWGDGTKTVVKRAEGEKWNEYNAFCAALAIKIFGNNSRVRKIVNSGEHQIKKGKKKDE